MPKVFILIVFLFIFFQGLPAQPRFKSSDSDTIKTNQSNYLQTSLHYTNFYTLKKPDGTVRRLYSLQQFLKSSVQFNKYQLAVSYRDYRLESFANHLDTLSGRLRFQYRNRAIKAKLSQNLFNGRLYLSALYNDFWGAGIGFETSDYGFNIDVSPYSGVFAGQVENSGGNVPLAAYSILARIFYQNTAVCYRRLAPLHPDSSYQNNIYGDIVSAETSISLPWQLELSMDASYGNIRAYLNYRHNPYGYLDHFQFFYYSFLIKRVFYENNQLSLGNNGFYGWSGQNSYLEIWPFNYWSQLMASKTRFTKTDMELNLPFIEYIKHLDFKRRNKGLAAGFRIRWSQFLFRNKFIYKERYFILYPVLIGYTTYPYSFKPDIDALLLLNGQVEGTFNELKIRGEISQLLPVRFKNLNKTTDFAGTSSREYGGFWVSLSLQYEFE